MKVSKIIIILLFSLIGLAATNESKAQPGISVSFNTFYDELGQYGRWINHPQYGQVWVYDEPDFRPYYTNGHWEYTDYGWEWVSNYDWGWAPFHYGRWEEDPYYGWIWIPGYDWAPAWVTWGEYDGYYGWAPLGYGLGLDVSINAIPASWWVFAPRTYITSPTIWQYCVPFNRSRYFYRNAVVINNYYDRGGRRFMMGPERREVERFTHTTIEPRRIDNNRFEWHGQGNRNDAFRPNNIPGRNDNFYGRRNNGFPQDNRVPQNAGRENNGWRNNDNRNNPMNNNPENNSHWRRDDFNRQPFPSAQQPQRAPVPPQSQAQPEPSWRNNRPSGGFNNGNFQRPPVYNNPAPRPQPQPNFGGGGWHERAPQQNDFHSGANNNARGRFSERRN